MSDLVHLSSLPWASLGQSLSEPTLLTLSSIKRWKSECTPIFEAENYPSGGVDPGTLGLVNGSNYQLIDQPSGLCADTLSCAFKRCDWSPKHVLDIMGGDYNKVIATWPPRFSMREYVDFDAVPDEDWNLPYAAVHPKTAADVLAAIDFGRSHGAGLSVKTSGHSYTGSSTAKNSILINMRKYPKYASEFTEESLLECTEDDSRRLGKSHVKTRHLRNNACRVALSRGVHAILRVGGGEIWDEVYRAVSRYNEDKVGLDDEKLYNIVEGKRLYNSVGGSAGTVSATGGFLSATGLSGNSGTMRMFGFAVDQVVQIEMALSAGHHVRFGPTEWMEDHDAPSDWPQTTGVTGWCNDDSTQPEESWTWHDCALSGIPVDFEELWHAVRGGGAGYGVILSVEYQLPEYPGPLTFAATALPENYTDLATVACGDCIEANELLQDIWTNYIIDAYFNPSAVGMSEDESSLCGGNTNLGLIFGSNNPSPIVCHGNGEQHYIDAWKRTVSDAQVRQRMLDVNLSQDMIDAVANFITPTMAPIRDYTRYAVIISSMIKPGGVPEGRVFDSPSPNMLRNPASDGLIVPVSFLVDERDVSVPWLTEYGRATERGVTGGMYMMGAKAGHLHDGTTATGSHYRGGAFYAYFAETLIDLRRTLYQYKFGEGMASDESNFPSFAEYNHMQNDFRGPLKVNWSEPCPRESEDFPAEQRDEQCIPIMEYIFGTEGLARLESVKSMVDPDHLFNSIGTVGYREMKTRLGGASPATSAS